MNIKDREYIGASIRHELKEGTHTYTMCECGRRGCRSVKCWECWLSDLVQGKSKEMEESEK